jgi:antitoxin (DNA-binding transcriptional repressor) of toxin-antitoxin stability system
VNEIGVAKLKRNTNGILRRVRENQESFNITYRGRVIALLVPSVRPSDYLPEEEREKDWRTVWAEMDELAAEISKKWPAGVSAVDAVGEQRRNVTPDEWVTQEDKG